MNGPRLSIIPARAATDRALKPRDLQVLCVLGRHTNELGWCRKSQVKMADEMGCARSTVFEAIERLVKAGYLERYEQEDVTGRDSPHVYRVILDPKHSDPGSVRDADSDGDTPADQPAPPAGISAPPAGSEPAPPAGPEPAPKNDSSRTMIQNVEREARGQEPERTSDPREVERWLKRHHPRWPSFVADSGREAFKAAMALTDDERAAAAERLDDYVAAERAQKGKSAFSVYLNEKRWERLPEKPAEADKPAYAPAFGPVWGGKIYRILLTVHPVPTPIKPWEERAIANGALSRESAERSARQNGGWPQVNPMLAAAAQRGAGIYGHGEADVFVGRLTEFVPVNTDMWRAWKAEHERRGWPWLPDPGRGAYFPAGGPERIGEFEQAVRGNHDAGGREAAE